MGSSRNQRCVERIRCIKLLYDLLFIFKFEAHYPCTTSTFWFGRFVEIVKKRSNKTQNTNDSDNEGGYSKLGNSNGCTDGKENSTNNAENGRQRFKINYRHVDICPRSDNCPCGYNGKINTQPNCGHTGFELFFCIEPFLLWLLITLGIGIGLNIYYLYLILI